MLLHVQLKTHCKHIQGERKMDSQITVKKNIFQRVFCSSISRGLISPYYVNNQQSEL
jgi:hypothetical protein